MRTNKRFPLVIVVFMIVLAATFIAIPNSPADNAMLDTDKRSIVELDQNYDSAMADLAAAGNYNGLPIGEIKSYPADGAKSIAILLPQNHKYPGTEASDAKNDSAEVTQKQIYQILGFLVDRYGIEFVMAEGDLTGEVPADKIANLSEKIQLRQRFSQLVDQAKSRMNSNTDPAIKEKFAAAAEKTLSQVDREIILAGAPYVLKAENKKFSLLGTENKDTYEKCAQVVRNYTYQQDRLSECQQSGNKLAQTNNQIATGGSDIASILSKLAGKSASAAGISDMLSNILSGNRFPTVLNAVAKIATANNDTELTGVIDELSSTYSEMQAPNEKVSELNSLPARAQNPYQGISDIDQLNGMIDDSEQKIQELVIDKRNVETAANFAQAVNSRGEKVGVIQYGAGHEEGLVRELNKLAITVVVVKPKEVSRREQAGE